MAILLAGGGNAKQSIEVDLAFRKSLPASPSVLFLPHAITTSTWSLEQAMNWVTSRDAFDGIEIRPCTDLATLGQELRSADAVFIMGGNTFELLQAVREAGVADHLLRCVRDGLVYGCSAGAIIAGETIHTSAAGRVSDDNTPGLTDLQGLRAVPGLNIYPHYDTVEDTAIQSLVTEHGWPILAISECGGCLCSHSLFTNIGSDAVALFLPERGRLLLPPGQSITLELTE
jgi:peptidase E